MKTKNLPRTLLTVCAVAALVACGGGGGGGGAVGNNENPVVEPTVTSFTEGSVSSYADPALFVNTAPPLASSITPSAGATSTGNLNARIFQNDGASSVATAIVNYTAPSGVVTVPINSGEVKVTTSDGYLNSVFQYTPTGGVAMPINGLLKAAGNIGGACLDETDTGGRLFVSSNIQQASNINEITAVLKGKSFDENTCTGDTSVFVFNSDGSLTVNSTFEGTTSFTSGQVAQAFSATGASFTAASSIVQVILRLYKYSPAGSNQTQYFIGAFFDDGTTKTTSLLVQK
jgi:hypothetical protein